MISTIHPGILICLGICLMMLIGAMGRETIFGLLKRAIIGTSLIIAINLFVPDILKIGINGLTIGCTSLLGIPGVIMLYLVRWII